MYGKKQIVMERDEVDSLKKFEDPGLYLIGFKPLKMLKTHHHIHPAAFIYPEEEIVKGRDRAQEAGLITSRGHMCLLLTLTHSFSSLPFIILLYFLPQAVRASSLPC